MSKIIYESELYHHGIIGQKWGIRRYQNKDGSLTAAGRKRVAKLEGELSGLKVNSSGKSAAPRKKVSEMTDEELDRAISRGKKEDEYRKYYPDPKSKKYFDGKEFTVKILSRSAENILTQLSANEMGEFVNYLFGKEVVNPKKGQKDK